MAFWSVRFPIQTLAISIIAIVRLIASGKTLRRYPNVKQWKQLSQRSMKTVVNIGITKGRRPVLFKCALFSDLGTVYCNFPSAAMAKVLKASSPCLEYNLQALKRTADRHCEIDYFTVISLANSLLECQWPVWENFIGSYWITHVAKITATAKRW